MGAAIKAGVVLAVAVEIYSVIHVLAGLHTSMPLMSGILFLLVVIALNVGCVFWGLKQTAAVNTYGKQLLSAVVIGLVAAVLIVLFSMINLTVLFPDYVAERNDAMIGALEGMNLPQETLDQQTAKIEAATPARESVNGGIGAFFTSVIVGAIVAIFKRKKTA